MMACNVFFDEGEAKNKKRPHTFKICGLKSMLGFY